MGATWIEVRISASLAAVRVVTDLLEVAMRAAFVEEALRHDATLAVAELVTNVVEHEKDEEHGEVSVRVDVLEGELLVTVTSRGSGYDVAGAIAAAKERTPLDESTEGGMGLLILASLFDVTAEVAPGAGHRILLRRAM